jgi:hypothetical protein
MKTFSDLLATDFYIDISIKLTPVVANGPPHVCVVVNNRTLWDQQLEQQVRLTHTVGLLDLVNISIKMSNKTYSSTQETAVVIESIQIDDFEIVPNFTQLAKYTNDANTDIVTTYIGFNGIWALDLLSPFYQWKHQITGQGWLLAPTNQCQF